MHLSPSIESQSEAIKAAIPGKAVSLADIGEERSGISTDYATSVGVNSFAPTKATQSIEIPECY